MEIKGLGGSPGWEIGKACVYEPKNLSLAREEIADPEAEIASMDEARKRYGESLAELAKNAGDKGEIFEAYQEILEDDYFFDGIRELIRSDKVCSSYAIEQKRAETAAMFADMDDEYLKARADDISNVCNELIAEIQGISSGDPFGDVEGDSLIIFAEDLTPADTVRMDRSRLHGMVTERGGVTSHTVILAKAMGIPAIVGAGSMLSKVSNGQTVLINGSTGVAIVDPDAATKQAFEEKKAAADRRKALYEACREKPAISKDGKLTRVNINSGDEESIKTFNPQFCDGIGLFRTEFIYMGQTNYPSEDVQFEAYKSMAEKAGGKELIIRTLDIGGDKQLDYMNIPKENNPFLGYRAIRLCLDRTEIFKMQLRAILRASKYGNVKIMFPMIVNMEELLRSKQLLEEAKQELRDRGEEFSENIPTGIMVETPAAVLLSDKLAKECDFFSVGSNDLIQYTTASDRQNESVQHIYDNCNISFLRAVKMACDNAHAAGDEIGICGETASEPRLIPLWLAMGIDELSVAPGLVGRTKYLLTQLDREEMKKVLDQVLDSSSIADVKKTMDEILGRIFV